MAARQVWCAEKVSKLLNEDSRLSTLNEIKDHFSAVSQDEAIQTADMLHLPSVFDCLNDSNAEQVDLACEVLSLCMSNLTVGESTNRYGVPLERALSHPYSSVKLMALQEIHRNTLNIQSLIFLSQRVSLLSAIIICIGDEDLSVAKMASDVIILIGTKDSTIERLLVPDVLKTIHEVMNVSAVTRMRVYEVIMKIAKENERILNMLDSQGLLMPILRELDNNDILLRLNIIEILSHLVLTRHGYIYLESHGVINQLFRQLDDGDPVSLLICEPGILRFFGHIAHWKPAEIFSKYSPVVDRIFSNLKTDDLSIVGVSLDTIGHIGETNEGKYALNLTGQRIESSIRVIVSRLVSFPTEIRIRALNCLENLIRVIEVEPNITEITRKWYDTIAVTPMDVILKYAQNPFSEIRLAGLGLVDAISTQEWGQDCIKNTPGLVEFLLDRRIETVKDCKELKHEIAKKLSMSTVFDHATLVRLQEFVNEGPFYVQTVTEVAIEGNE